MLIKKLLKPNMIEEDIMSNKVLTIELESNLVNSAESVLNEIGLDVSTYIRIALMKLVKEQRVPFSLAVNQPLSAAVSTPVINPACDEDTELEFVKSEPRQMIKITGEMCQSIWEEFRRSIASRNVNWQESAQRISAQTGMSRGSAFIYFTILNNLVSGAQNTRSLKMEDLEFFIGKIKTELPEQMFKAAISSLEASIPYWDEKVPGAFAEKVSKLVEKLKR